MKPLAPIWTPEEAAQVLGLAKNNDAFAISATMGRDLGDVQKIIARKLFALVTPAAAYARVRLLPDGGMQEVTEPVASTPPPARPTTREDCVQVIKTTIHRWMAYPSREQRINVLIDCGIALNILRELISDDKHFSFFLLENNLMRYPFERQRDFTAAMVLSRIAQDRPDVLEAYTGSDNLSTIKNYICRTLERSPQQILVGGADRIEALAKPPKPQLHKPSPEYLGYLVADQKRFAKAWDDARTVRDKAVALRAWSTTMREAREALRTLDAFDTWQRRTGLRWQPFTWGELEVAHRVRAEIDRRGYQAFEGAMAHAVALDAVTPAMLETLLDRDARGIVEPPENAGAVSDDEAEPSPQDLMLEYLDDDEARIEAESKRLDHEEARLREARERLAADLQRVEALRAALDPDGKAIEGEPDSDDSGGEEPRFVKPKRSVFSIRLRVDLQDRLRELAANEERIIGVVVERLLEQGLTADKMEPKHK
jgi:hypothetical protein